MELIGIVDDGLTVSWAEDPALMSGLKAGWKGTCGWWEIWGIKM